MPSAPIVSRTLLWRRLSDGTVQVLDWNTVTTSLGAMVESRSIAKARDGIADENLFDSSFSALSVAPVVPSGNYALDQLMSSAQWPHYRAIDPGVQ
jgi:hypothetical protein